ncbi:hypothetical protein ABT294_00495 [Nonomuraea sp. NPDC000554]|uniref:hypothetical protein n=1 Tax=Nonomuraea sp. NPDC000554 TaxID=3154259 RepID=UPI0033222426
MLRRLLVSAALVGSALAIPVAVSLPASASVQGHASTAASCYKQQGTHWVCITPGAFCPKAAHQRYGYAKVTNRKYKCIYKSSDPYWRWRRA